MLLKPAVLFVTFQQGHQMHSQFLVNSVLFSFFWTKWDRFSFISYTQYSDVSEVYRSSIESTRIFSAPNAAALSINISTDVRLCFVSKEKSVKVSIDAFSQVTLHLWKGKKYLPCGCWTTTGTSLYEITWLARVLRWYSQQNWFSYNHQLIFRCRLRDFAMLFASVHSSFHFCRWEVLLAFKFLLTTGHFLPSVGQRQEINNLLWK